MAERKNMSYSKNMRSKYKNRAIETEDGRFDSKREYAHWINLKELEKAGKISKLRRQVKFTLLESQKLPTPVADKNGRLKRTERPVVYVADFVYVKDGNVIVEDSKGFVTDVYSIKRKLMLKQYGIQIMEV